MKSSRTPEELKQLVKEKYSQLATERSSCCGPSATRCGEDEVSFIGDAYQGLEGYHPEADLGLGCGLPTQHAHLRPGQTVVDLGSGAGNDCFIARRFVGESGRVIGIDMAPPMIELAHQNARDLGYTNVTFHLGEIESLPLPENTADVVVSNCVLNLVPDKVQAFAEMYRILKPGGHFSISDVVTVGALPEHVRTQAEMYVGCVAGALDQDVYLQHILDQGFEALEVQSLRRHELPAKVLATFSEQELEQFQAPNGIYSLTVFARKPLVQPPT